MRLAELSPAEQQYLRSPLPRVDHWTPLLMNRLAHMLHARLKRPVEMLPAASVPPRPPQLVPREIPAVLWNDALEAMWIRARLGGPVRVHARCAALSRNLEHDLQCLLAETWLSTAHDMLPASVCWRIVTPGSDAPVDASLTIHFPDTLALMDRWAQRTIAS